MKLSIVLSCLVFTGCGAAEPAFIEESVDYVVSGGQKDSSGSGEGMDAGSASSEASETGGPIGSTETGGAAAPETAVAVADSKEALPPASVAVAIGDADVDVSSSGSAASSGTGGRTGVEEGSGSGSSGEGSAPSAGGVDQSSQLPAQCRALGGAGTRVHVVSSQARIVNPEATVLVAHVNGNRGALSLVLDGAHAYKGLCILANGNQASVSVDVGVSVGHIVYAGRGNQSSATLFVRGSGEVKKANVSLAGNAASLAVDVGSSQACAAFSVDKAKGKGASFRCE